MHACDTLYCHHTYTSIPCHVQMYVCIYVHYLDDYTEKCVSVSFTTIVVCECRADYTPGALPYLLGSAPCADCSNPQSCVNDLCTGGESDVHILEKSYFSGY